MSTKKYNPKDVGSDDPDVDHLASYSASLDFNQRPEFSNWSQWGSPTPGYPLHLPSFTETFYPDYSLVVDLGSRSGDRFNTVLLEFPAAYLTCKADTADKEIGVLDKWVDDILRKLKKIYAITDGDTATKILNAGLAKSKSGRTPKPSAKSPARKTLYHVLQPPAIKGPRVTVLEDLDLPAKAQEEDASHVEAEQGSGSESECDSDSEDGCTNRQKHEASPLGMTVIMYARKYRSGKKACPQITADTFRALRSIQPILAIFKTLTLKYSAADAPASDVILDFHLAIESLQSIAEGLHSARRQSCLNAAAKLEKYLDLALKNNWLCATFA